MTQATRIFSFLVNNPLTRPKDIANRLKIPQASVRRALFNLRQKNIVSRPRKDFTASIKLFSIESIRFRQEHDLETKEKPIAKQISELFWTKILKTGNSEIWDKDIVASTWEHGESPKRFDELKKAILEFGDLERIRIGDLGYSRISRKTEPDFIPEFPEIEVHTE